MTKAERALREEIIAQCRWMNATGLNQGTSGNISARFEDRMLLTPSATPYDAMEPEMIVSMPLDGEYGAWEGPLPPSTEWRFHLDIQRARPDVGAVVHTHATHCATLAICGKGIPSCHYMIAAFGGPDIRCSRYERYGTAELSAAAIEALEGRMACLLGNHGMIAVGPSLAKAMWLASELETLAKQYYLSLLIGGPNLLSEAQIAETAEAMKSYGLREDDGDGEAEAKKPARPRRAGARAGKPEKKAGAARSKARRKKAEA